MCTLAVYVRCSSDYPLVVAANRDEFYDRPAVPPGVLQAAPWIVGGRDVRAGGTWLGVSAHHLVAGILNRRTQAVPDPLRRSRGQLCVDALQHSSAAAAAGFVGRESALRYNPFNLLVTDPEEAFVIGNGSGSMRSTLLATGVHVLTNLDLDDMECPRLAKSFAHFTAAAEHLVRDDLPALLRDLGVLLADHSTPLDPRSGEIPNNLCVHTERFGTRCSTIVAYDRRQQQMRLWHAEGPPCRSEYQAVALPPALDIAGATR